eukprot:TRINITY_DN10691_c1_g1_i1.p7 TRINITY_DN10691_c1_g1~~TRINITY_DN10691_c1_g1_i1.p7  ORF type:complete len:121 (+),score=14.54 TRINITY_DN10691_c1_g1_i1:24-365(+)
MSSGQTLGVKAQRFRGHTSPHRNVKEKKIDVEGGRNYCLKKQSQQLLIQKLFFIIFNRSPNTQLFTPLRFLANCTPTQNYIFEDSRNNNNYNNVNVTILTTNLIITFPETIVW